MIYGLDTGFLVAMEVREHAAHAAAHATLARLFAAGDRLAVAPQVLAEFIHVVTERLFQRPKKGTFIFSAAAFAQEKPAPEKMNVPFFGDARPSGGRPRSTM